MPDPASRVAHAVLSENLKVKKGESVLIESWTHGLPYARAFVREARKIGARPTILYEDEGAWWDAVDAGHTKGFTRLSEAERAALKNADVYVYIWGPEDRPRASRLPGEVQETVTGFNEEWYDVAQKSGIRGCRLSVGMATGPQAELFGIDAKKWQSQMLEAGASSAKTMRSKGEKVARLLEGGSELRIEHPNGTDLTLRLKGVHTRVDAGFVSSADMKRRYGLMANNPSGQVLAGIDRTKAQGTLVSNRPVFIGPDKYEGIQWKFEDGRLVSHSISGGTEQFEKQFADAPKARDRLTFLSIGLNPKSKTLPPCEDTEEGSVLVGIGANAPFGGTVRIPFQGYALVGGATISVDGRVIAKGGKIL